MTETIVVCEDKLTGRVLGLLIARAPDKDVTFVVAHGKSNVLPVAAHHRNSSGYAKVCTVRDRDYQSASEASASWAADSNDFIWTRHEIENYLLDPRVVSAALEALADEYGANWPMNVPTCVGGVNTMLQQLAAGRLQHHAGWLCYFELRDRKNDIGDTRILYPEDLQAVWDSNAWISYLGSEVQRLATACQAVASSPKLSSGTVTELYNRILADVSAPQYLTSGDYLLDLPGKELLEDLARHIYTQGIQPQRSQSLRELLEERLIGALGRVYEPGFFDPDDFGNLASRL